MAGSNDGKTLVRKIAQKLKKHCCCHPRSCHYTQPEKPAQGLETRHLQQLLSRPVNQLHTHPLTRHATKPIDRAHSISYGHPKSTQLQPGARNILYILQNVKSVYRPVNWFWSFSGKNFPGLPVALF